MTNYEGLIGVIDKNKIFSEYFRQGFIYKNEKVFNKTKNLSDEEIDKLPLKDKICYIPEGSFDNKDYIDLNDNLKDGSDYYTYKSIKEDIMNYFGEEVINKISDKDMRIMVEDVFYTVDWQHPSSLLDADQYLDEYVDELLEKNGYEV